MELLALTGRIVLVGIFVAAIGGKVASRSSFVDFAASLRRLGLVPARQARALAQAVVVTELAVVALLVVPGATWLGATLAAALLGLFAVAVAASLRRGAVVPCRCFGRSRVPLGPAHVARNVLLAALALLCAVATAQVQAPPAAADWLAAFAMAAPLLIVSVMLDDIISIFSRPAGLPEA